MLCMSINTKKQGNDLRVAVLFQWPFSIQVKHLTEKFNQQTITVKVRLYLISTFNLDLLLPKEIHNEQKLILIPSLQCERQH